MFCYGFVEVTFRSFRFQIGRKGDDRGSKSYCFYQLCPPKWSPNSRLVDIERSNSYAATQEDERFGFTFPTTTPSPTTSPKRNSSLLAFSGLGGLLCWTLFLCCCFVNLGLNWATWIHPLLDDGHQSILVILFVLRREYNVELCKGGWLQQGIFGLQIR